MKLRKDNRNSSFELLRIIAIIMVIMSHFNVHSGFNSQLSDTIQFNFNYFLTVIFSIGCFANAIFVIMTGYFLSKSKIKARKITSLILEMYFYSLLIFFVFWLVAPEKTNAIDLKSVFLPFPFGNWFLVCYIALYAFSPLLNKIIRKMGQAKLRKIILVLSPIIFIATQIIDVTLLSNASSFLICYAIGAYIRGNNVKLSRRCNVLGIAGIYGLLIIIVFLLYLSTIYTKNVSFFNLGIRLISSNTSVFVIIIATLTFLLFKEMKMKYNAKINQIAKSVLGIYLIHDNPLVRALIWREVYPVNIEMINIFQLVSTMIVKVLVVFVVCLVIDQARYVLIAPSLDKKKTL